MRIDNDLKLDYKDVLIRPKRSNLESRKSVDITRTLKFKRLKNELEVIPIIASNMDGIGTFSMAKALIDHKMMTALHKFYDIDQLAKFFKEIGSKSNYIFYTLGMKENEIEKLELLLKKIDSKLIQNICVDVANGYTEKFVDYIKKIREKYPKKRIMAGNVVTGEMVEQLILSGADIVKVGIGPGSTCITRKIAGVGYPQLSAVIECADAAHGISGMICADGGCQVPGDIAKAFGAGSDFVMLGGMLAGHIESEFETFEENGEKYLHFYGSSSKDAMTKHFGHVAEYRASEGKSVKIKFKGSVLDTTLRDILGGLRSACTYVGAKNLKELTKRTTFVRVSQQLNEMFKD